MNLLEDVFIIENLQVINEGRGTGPMKIKGCFQRADEANNNKRIYRKPLLEREITKLADALVERRLMGELDHPQNDSVKLSNVSHLITGLNMKGNEVIGEAEILNTPAGKVAQALIEGGVKIGISSRGMGTVTEELDGKRYVNEDFKLITWDIVADPSTRGAYPGLTESTQIQEIIDRVYPEAQKVKNFTTLLKEELTVESIPATSRGPSLEKPTPGENIASTAHGSGRIYSRNIARARSEGDTKSAAFLKKRAAVEGAAKKGAIQLTTPGRGGGPSTAGVTFSPPPQQLQNASTQFVNFMRDKLNEAPVSRAHAELAQRQLNKQLKKERIAKLNLDRRIEMGDRQDQRRYGFRKSRTHMPKRREDASTQFVNFMRDKLNEKVYAGDPRTRELKRARAYGRAAAAGGPRAIKRAKRGHGFNTVRWSETEIKQAHDEGRPVPSRASQSRAPRSKVKAATKRRRRVHPSAHWGGETRRDAAADAAHSRKKVQDAGDQ